MATIRVARDEIAAIDKQMIELQARRADLEAYVRVHQSLERGGAPRKRRSGEARQTISNAVETILKDGSIKSTKDILSHLHASGIDVPGDNKEQRLSQILSREKKTGRFEADRKRGWSLPKKTITLVLKPKAA